MVRVSGRPMVMTALAVALLGTVAFAQRWTPADAAAKLTGTWQINFELSPQFAQMFLTIGYDRRARRKCQECTSGNWQEVDDH